MVGHKIYQRNTCHDLDNGMKFRHWLIKEDKVHVISITDPKQAVILLTQGIEPSFKPQIASGFDYAPGRGIDREGLYVISPNEEPPGVGGIKLHLMIDKSQLKVPPEHAQRGTTDLDFALRTADGAVTQGRIDKSVFTGVEVYSHKTGWTPMTPQEFLASMKVGETPQLPTVDEFRKTLEARADELFLKPHQVHQIVHDYNRSSLENKIMHAKELGLL
jgi:hypothetical protein